MSYVIVETSLTRSTFRYGIPVALPDSCILRPCSMGCGVRFQESSPHGAARAESGVCSPSSNIARHGQGRQRVAGEMLTIEPKTLHSVRPAAQQRIRWHAPKITRSHGR